MKNLKYLYSTGQSKRHIEIGSAKDKVTHKYEAKVVTPSGVFKEKEWELLISNQAKELFEVNILDTLKNYSLNNLAWINTDEEAYQYSLKLYAYRIWENKFWVGYEVFNKLLNKQEHIEQISLL